MAKHTFWGIVQDRGPGNTHQEYYRRYRAGKQPVAEHKKERVLEQLPFIAIGLRHNALLQCQVAFKCAGKGLLYQYMKRYCKGGKSLGEAEAAHLEDTVAHQGPHDAYHTIGGVQVGSILERPVEQRSHRERHPAKAGPPGRAAPYHYLPQEEKTSLQSQCRIAPSRNLLTYCDLCETELMVTIERGRTGAWWSVQ